MDSIHTIGLISILAGAVLVKPSNSQPSRKAQPM